MTSHPATRLASRFGFALLAGVVLVSPAAFAASADDTAAMLQKAQAAKGADAAPLWEALLRKDLKVPGYDADAIRQKVIENLDQAAETTGETAYYRKALSQAIRIKHPQTRFALLSSILNSQLMHGDVGTAWSSYLEAQAIVDHLPEGAERSRYAALLVHTLLTGSDGMPATGKDGVEKARLLLAQTSFAGDRASAEHAIAVAETALDMPAQGDGEAALRAILAEPSDAKDRDARLLAVAHASEAANDALLAAKAIGGIARADVADPALRDLAKALIARKELSAAGDVASNIEHPAEKIEALSRLAEAYHGVGYDQRVTVLDATIREILPKTEEPSQPDALARAATHFAAVGDTGLAEIAIKDASDSKLRDEAYAALARAYALSGDAENARQWYDRIDAPAQKSLVIADVARALAGNIQLSKARDLLGDAALTGSHVDLGRFAVALAAISSGEPAEAEKDAKQLTDPALKADALSQLARTFAIASKPADKAQADRLFAEAEGVAKAAADPLVAQKARGFVAAGLAGAHRIDQAVAMMQGLADAEARRPAEVALTTAYLAADNPNKAYEFAHALTPARNHDEALSVLGTGLAERQMIQLATAIIKEVTDTHLRVKTFRQVAEAQAKASDLYGILGGGVPAKLVPATLRLPQDLPKGTATEDDLKDYNDKTLEMVKSRTDPVLMRTPLSTDIGRKLPAIYRPENLKITAATVEKIVPMPTAFKASRMYYMDSVYNLKFYFAAGNQDFIARQGTNAPDMINLESGVVDLSQLAASLKARGLGHYLERDASAPGRTYVLRRPIVIGPKATLIVSAADVDELRLSGDAGAYLVNAGRLFIVDTKVTGWSEKDGKAMVVPDEPNTFRPYITSWSKSETNIVGTELTALGYTNSKSYGLSISSGPKAFTKVQSRELKRPFGIVADNYFRNFLYGFYCYEAEDVVLIGNEYRDNYTYAIDPHDRSRHLTIAYNTTYGTHKKHGIIISREVNYSTILGNLTFANNGSGIMTDRYSVGTLIYGNTAFQNHGDGLTVYESGCKLVAANRFFDNDRSGIKVRNSMDVGIFFNELRDNKQAAVNGYVLDLMHTTGHDTRDVVMDPYTNVTSLDVVGNLIQNNGVGINGDMLAALYMKNNRFLKQSPRLIRGSWGRVVPQMLSRSNFEEEGVFVTDRCIHGELATRSHCNFRDEGYFEGDGQDSLGERLETNYCKPAETGEAP